ncbi:transposase [Streptomyces sp. PRh5]|uniref:transposase n=1 Tax=Streptomyces sp. PRh5 TaxID=1158056 RepID=UPI0012FEB716|nr:transposase [Streptomyces sp. PRh5]
MGTSKYSPEFRADAVALYHAGPGGTYASVAKDLGVNHETLRTWVRDADQAARPGAGEASAIRGDRCRTRSTAARRAASCTCCPMPRASRPPSPCPARTCTTASPSSRSSAVYPPSGPAGDHGGVDPSNSTRTRHPMTAWGVLSAQHSTSASRGRSHRQHPCRGASARNGG